jgi:hypothetical protein
MSRASAEPYSDPAPIRIDDARHLANLGRNQRQLFYRQSENVDLNVERIVRAEFSDDSARHDIEVLKALDDAGERARISVGNDAKPTYG